MMNTRTNNVSLRDALKFWCKLGFISFGGPAGQIAIMHREMVERRRWFDEEEFLHALSFCMLLPGPEAQQLAIYTGWLLHRATGGILAGTLFVVPSIFVLLGLSFVYAMYREQTIVAGILSGIKPIVIAIVIDALFRIGGKALRSKIHYAIAVTAFCLIYFVAVPFPLIVLGAAAIGFMWMRLQPSTSRLEVESSSQTISPKDDAISHTSITRDASLARHRQSSSLGRRALKVVLIGIGLWLIPLIAVIAWSGSDGLHTQLYLFFTQAALITFGGAYAVLAYVTQAVVETFGWVTTQTAIDGLALAETTPGPLIMVLQFIGFMAGWNNPGNMNQSASALLAALLTTYATFLPCFVFVLAGAPYIEVLRGNEKIKAALQGVTAAIVGVIANLAVVFGAAVILDERMGNATRLVNVVLVVCALVALRRFKIDVLWLILGGALFGIMFAVWCAL